MVNTDQLVDMAKSIYDVIDDIVDIVDKTGALKSVLDAIFVVYRERRECSSEAMESLFWDIYSGAAADAINKRINCACGLKGVKAFWKIIHCKDDFPRFEFDQYFFAAPGERPDILLDSYKMLFAQLEQKVRDQQIFDGEKISEIFQDIAEEAFEEWKIDFRKARKKYLSFDIRFSEQQIERLSDQISGKILPCDKRSGHDLHLYERRVKGTYWSQSIRFDGTDGRTFRARPDPPNNREEIAEEDQKNEDDWWKDLSSWLSGAPRLLIGPGGIGKTAFLADLYETVTKKRMGEEFGGAFLLSLETMMAAVDNAINIDSELPNPPEKSIILQHIAARSGNTRGCRGWEEAFRNGRQFYNQKPILLLLDGFSEILAQKELKQNAYKQIVDEITALSNHDIYRYLRIILTSRVESGDRSKGELEIQRSELSMGNFQIWHLNGITGDVLKGIPSDIELSDEIKELLTRPLYYAHIQELINQPNTLSNRYQALDIIYKSMTEQSIANGPTEETRLFRRCIFEFLLPIIAYHEWKNRELTSKKLEDAYLEDAYKEWTGRYCRRLMCDNLRVHVIPVPTGHEEAYNKSINFLLSQEQILIQEGSQYMFSHQDYRDFLVARYFLQRMEHIHFHMDLPYWDDTDIISALRPNTYGKDILALIYQGISFKTGFVEYFLIHPEGIDRMTSGCILWYNAAYQLSDLTGPAGFKYGDRKRLSLDTLQVLKPLTSYVYEESQVGPPHGAKPLTEFIPPLRKHMAEILMKSSEIYRLNQNLESARQMITAAQYIYKNEPEAVPYLVKHHSAHVDLCDFKSNGRTDRITSSLETLLECSTCAEDQDGKILSQRYSCSMLSMLLISPQAVLERRPEYQAFVARLARQHSESMESTESMESMESTESMESITLFAFWKACNA